MKFDILQDCASDVILGMNLLCEYGANINLGEYGLALRQPVPPPKGFTVKATAVRILADHANPPSRSSVLISFESDEAFCAKVLLESSVQLLLKMRIWGRKRCNNAPRRTCHSP